MVVEEDVEVEVEDDDVDVVLVELDDVDVLDDVEVVVELEDVVLDELVEEEVVVKLKFDFSMFPKRNSAIGQLYSAIMHLIPPLEPPF